ncbi:MAG: YbbR-like domain-containing protein [Chloroflexia bacterium]
MDDDSSQPARPDGPSTAAARKQETALVDEENQPRPQTRLTPEERTNGSDGARATTVVQPALDDRPETDTGPIRVLGGGSDLSFEGLTLEQALADVDAKPAPARRTFPSLPPLPLDERLGRILLSIVLAALLWFYVVSLENPTRSTSFSDLSVEVRGLTGQMKVINTLPTVSAFVQAPQNVLSRLGKGDIHPYVELAGLPEGVHDVPIQSEVTGGRAGEVDVSASPARVQVQLGLHVTRAFTLTVETLGAPAFGYGMGDPQVEPDRVVASGPRDAMNRVVSVKVLVDVEGRADTQQGLKAPVALDASGSEIKDISFTPATVQVVVPIKLLLNYKVVPVRVPLQGQPATGYGVSLISIDPTNITACCDPDVLRSLDYVETKPVSITGTTTTIVTTTELILPPKVQLYPGQPKTIGVTVEVRAQQTTQQASVEVSVVGVTEGLSAVVSPNRVNVTLSGTLNQLQNLSPTDVRAVVNADGRAPGSYNVKPEVKVPQGVKIESSTPTTVTLTLIAPTPVPTQTPSPTQTPRPLPSPSPTAVPPTPSAPIPTPSPIPPPPATPTSTPAAPATRTQQVLPTGVP